MRLFSISLRNLRIRIVATVLTTISILVATGLYAAIQLMAEQTEQRYKGSIEGYQAVFGPKDASPLQIVLNTIFNVGDSPGLIPLQVCTDVRNNRVGRRSVVRYAIPQARGDSFSRYNFPVIGTIDEMFSLFHWEQEPLKFAVGGPWQFTYQELLTLADQLAEHENRRRAGEAPLPPRPALQPHWRQAVLGSRVARRLGMGMGSRIVPMHGKADDPFAHEHPEASCEVVGILEPTNTPLDSTIFIPLGTHLLVDGHEGGLFHLEIPPGGSPETVKTMPVSAARIGLTAVIADPKDHIGARMLRTDFSTRADAQVADAKQEVPRFLRDIGNIADALKIVAWLVLMVAAVSITAAIYNTMNERRREIAIMRSLGARRSQIAAIIVGEAAFLSLVGSILGVLACHLATYLLRSEVEEMTGVFLDWTAFTGGEVMLVLGVTALGAVAGLLPAIKGSLTQVADNLAPNY